MAIIALSLCRHCERNMSLKGEGEWTRANERGDEVMLLNNGGVMRLRSMRWCDERGCWSEGDVNEVIWWERMRWYDERGGGVTRGRWEMKRGGVKCGNEWKGDEKKDEGWFSRGSMWMKRVSGGVIEGWMWWERECDEGIRRWWGDLWWERVEMWGVRCWWEGVEFMMAVRVLNGCVSGCVCVGVLCRRVLCIGVQACVRRVRCWCVCPGDGVCVGRGSEDVEWCLHGF